jgi:hypothetical protein
VKIEGFVERDALDWAISRVVREVEPVKAAFCESDGQVLQSAIAYPEVGLDFFDLSGSLHPVQETREMTSSIQRTSMPSTGQLFKFLLFQTRADEFHLFVCGHHIVIDGFSLALLCPRIASVYSAIVSGALIAPSIFGSSQDLLDCESEYEASKDYLEDHAYWIANLPAISEPRYRLPDALGESDPYRSSGPVRLDPVVLRRVEQLCQLWNMPRSSVITAACALLVLRSIPTFSSFVHDRANPAASASATVRHVEIFVGVLVLSIAAALLVRLVARQRAQLPARDANVSTLATDSDASTPISRLLGKDRGEDAAAEAGSGSALRRLLGRAQNAWESGSLWVALVIGFWAGPNPSLALFALTTILASGATIGTQIGAAIVFILETLAVVEVALVSNLVTPTKTQALLRTLHDRARAYRQQILVAMFTLVGLALVAQGAGGL